MNYFEDYLLEDEDLFDDYYDEDFDYDDYDDDFDDYYDEDFELALYEEPARKIKMFSNKKTNLDAKYAEYAAKRRAHGKPVKSKTEWIATRNKLKKAAKIAAITGGSAAAIAGGALGAREIAARRDADYIKAKNAYKNSDNLRFAKEFRTNRRKSKMMDELSDARHRVDSKVANVFRFGKKKGKKAGKLSEAYGMDADFYDEMLNEEIDTYDFSDIEAAYFEEGFNQGFSESIEYFD